MDTRDFSVDTIEEIYDIIEELKNQGTFLDSMGDFWIRGEPDAVMLCTYAANGEMEEYYRKYADSMNLTKEKFGKIVENVRAVDKKYQEKFTDAKEEMQDFQEKLKNLAQEISMRTISLSEGQYRRAVEVLEGEDNQKKRQLETLIGVTRGSSGSSRMEEKIREILKYSVGNGNLEDELDVESTESGISQKRKMITKVEELKQQFKKGKITQDELISQICELYHVEDYGSKINYSLAVKKYQPEKKAAIVSDIFSTVLYIIGEDGIDAEKIEEIRQSVSAKSYIDDETWDMVEKAFRGVVVGVNAAVAADYYGNVGKVESGRNTATTIDYSYKFDRELANFNDGYEIRTTVDKDLILVQYSSDAPDASLCYWTTVDEANGITTLNDYMDKLALSKDWGNRNTVKVARIPAGTEVKYAVGTAREQLLIADPRPGGGVQYLFNQFDTDWITEIRSFSN